jgi:predicted RNA-binding Zn ribbon-like protein
MRFKACRNDRCRWVFFDASKNRSSTWCSMASCGSRIKARTYRQRRRAAQAP